MFAPPASPAQSSPLAGEPNTLVHTLWAGIHGVATLHLANELSMGCSAETMLDALLRAHRPKEA